MTHGAGVDLPVRAAAPGPPVAGVVPVCVVDSQRSGPAYPRLASCRALEVVGHLPLLDARLLPWELVHQVTVVLVGTTVGELHDPHFQDQLVRLTRKMPVVVVMAGITDPATAARLGARGLVGQEVDPVALDRVVRAVASGEVAFPRSSLTVLFSQHFFGRTNARPAGAALTARQHEVASLIAGGATDREVAARLSISESTAHKHVQNALKRSHARTRSQLVALLRQQEAV